MSGERVMSARLEIEALDKTGKAFTDIGKKMIALQRLQKQITQVSNFQGMEQRLGSAVTGFDKMANSLERFSEVQKRVNDSGFAKIATDAERAGAATERAAQRVGTALDKQKQRAEALSQTLKDLGHAAAVGAGVATHFAYEKGAELQHNVVSLRNAGVPENDINRAREIATATAKTVPAIPVAEGLQIYQEARGSLQHPDEAFELLPMLSQAKSVLEAMGMQDARMGDLVKAGELQGLTKNKDQFQKFLNDQVRVMAVLKGTVTTNDIFEAAKYSKLAGLGYNDEFRNLILPSLIQEMGGASAGTGLSTLQKTLRGGLQNKHLPVQILKRLGLLEDPNAIVRTKTGEIKGYAGKLSGDELLGQNPFQWFNQVFKPAAEAKGYKTQDDQFRLINMLLGQKAGDVAAKFLSQSEIFEQHQRNYEAAPDVATMVENNRRDPLAAMTEMAGAFTNFASVLTNPAMDRAAKIMDSIAQSINGWAESVAAFQKAHPELAKGLAGGALVGGTAAGIYGSSMLIPRLLSIFTGSSSALNGSAAALTESAYALDAAAARLGGSSAGNAATATESAAAGGAASSSGFTGLAARGGIWFVVYAAAIAALNYAFPDRDIRKPPPKMYDQGDDASNIRSYRKRWGDLADNYYGTSPTGEVAEGGMWRGYSGFGPQPGQSAAEIKQALSGNAHIQVEVKPSPDFIASIKNIIKHEMSAFTVSGPGSTGRSEP